MVGTSNQFVRLENAINDLAACLCAKLMDAHDADPVNVLEPCFCGVVEGANVVNDFFNDCDNNDGMAWVRLQNSYPSLAPGEASTERGNLERLALGADIEIGVQRTVLMNDDGSVDPEQHAAMFHQQNVDMQAVYKAIACCTALRDMGVIGGIWNPIGPQGMTYGGFIVLYTQVA